jgi:hypothetical protein
MIARMLPREIELVLFKLPHRQLLLCAYWRPMRQNARAARHVLSSTHDDFRAPRKPDVHARAKSHDPDALPPRYYVPFGLPGQHAAGNRTSDLFENNFSFSGFEMKNVLFVFR